MTRTRPALHAALLTGLLLVSTPGIADDDIRILRAEQQSKLQDLTATYGTRAKGLDKSSPAYRDLLSAYGRDKAAIQREMLGKDGRGAELDSLLKQHKGEILNTGSRPRDVGADVDLAARTDAAANEVLKQWQGKYGEANVEVFGHKIVNHATDTTLWLPETPERLQMKLTDADAFYPEGGRKATGNVDAVRNETGWALANRQKFAHAYGHGGQPDDLKTMGKSLSKMFEGNDPGLRRGMFDDIKAPKSSSLPPVQVVEQANVLRNYGDVYEAGIADLGDSPEVVKQKVDAWKAQAADRFAVEEAHSLRRAQLQEKVQQALADSISDPETRARVEGRLNRSRESNKAILEQIRKQEAAVGLDKSKSPRAVAVEDLIAGHVEGDGPPKSPRPAGDGAEVRRPKLIVPDDVRAGTARPDHPAMKAYGLYDKATLAFNPVGALTDLANTMSAAPQPGAIAQGAGYALTVVNVALNYQKVWAEAEQGGNANIDFAEGDSLAVRRMKAGAAAILETTGAPGFMRDLGEAISKEFDQGDPDAGTLGKLLNVTGRLVAKSADAAIIKPVTDAILATEEGVKLVEAIRTEQAADARLHAQTALLEASRFAAAGRATAFDLPPIKAWVGAPGGSSLVGNVADGTALSFTLARTNAWTDAFTVEWRVEKDGAVQPFAPVKKTAAANPLSAVYQLMIKSWPAGTYTVRVMLRDARGVVHAREETNFSTGMSAADVGLGVSQLTLDAFDGPALDGPIEPGRILAVVCARVGQWQAGHRVEWYVNDTIYKKVPGTDPKAHLIRFRTDGIGGTGFDLTARIVDEGTGRIVSHKAWRVNFKAKDVKVGKLSVQGALNDYGGPAISGPVTNGQVLAFHSDVAFPAAEGPPPISELLWQVFDGAGKPMPGLSKRQQFAEAGSTERTTFKFRPENLPNGEYRVRLTHVLTAATRQEASADAGFKIYQAARIDRIVVTDKPGGEPAALYVDQAPYFYVYYALADGVPGVRADLRVTSGGQTVYETSVERPLKGNPKTQRVGVTIEAGTVKKDGVFSVTLTPKGGEPLRAEQAFTLKSYVVAIDMPHSLKSGEAVPYRVYPPERFEEPLTVSLTPSGLVLHQTGRLTGIATGVNGSDKYDESFTLSATVTDAKGRTARGSASGRIERMKVVAKADPKPAYKAPPPAAKAAPPQQLAPKPKVDLSGALKNFNDQMAAIRQQQNQAQAEIEAKNRQREKEMMQAMQKLRQPGYSPYGAAPSGGSVAAPAPSSSSGGGPCALRVHFEIYENGKYVPHTREDIAFINLVAETQPGCVAQLKSKSGSNWDHLTHGMFGPTATATICGIRMNVFQPGNLQKALREISGSKSRNYGVEAKVVDVWKDSRRVAKCMM
ncbi:hypothetical protein KFF05_02040 [bacterium SCSIO 12827]|nr:hypothetical protein KFF05_02040 [bacterium SCSIO 12827]